MIFWPKSVIRLQGMSEDVCLCVIMCAEEKQVKCLTFHYEAQMQKKYIYSAQAPPPKSMSTLSKHMNGNE